MADLAATPNLSAGSVLASWTEGRGSIVSPVHLRLIGHLRESCGPLHIAAIMIGGQIRRAHASVLPDRGRRNVAPIKQPNQILARNAQRICCLLSRQFVAPRQNRDTGSRGNDARSGFQNGKQRQRQIDRVAHRATHRKMREPASLREQCRQPCGRRALNRGCRLYRRSGRDWKLLAGRPASGHTSRMGSNRYKRNPLRLLEEFRLLATTPSGLPALGLGPLRDADVARQAPPQAHGDGMIRAVLDADVLYPLPLRDTLLSAAHEGCFQPAWSAEILDEAIQTGRLNVARRRDRRDLGRAI